MTQFPYRLTAVKWTSRIKLPFLVSSKVRIAEVAAVPSVQLARGFRCGEWQALADYQPQILVGTRSELQLLVEEMGRDAWELNSVDCAVVVLTYSYTAPLDDVFRVMLWQRFGVPIYELLVGPHNTLLAAECEAHEGWHIQPETEVFFAGEEIACRRRSQPPIYTGWIGSIEFQPCACGHKSIRLRDVCRPLPGAFRGLAAIA
jgi:hypothetical protein